MEYLISAYIRFYYFGLIFLLKKGYDFATKL